MNKSKKASGLVGNKDKVQLCSLPFTPDRILASNVDLFRLSLIRYHEKKWVNGTTLHYMFFKSPRKWSGASNQQEAVRNAFHKWRELGIGLEFEEVQTPEQAEIRIGFEEGAGSWSYVGRDAIDHVVDPLRRTMNFGWDLTTPYGRDTALHEIGHALGFPHEHQNPLAGIVWNVDAVIDEFSGPPNHWNEEQINHNILRKINTHLVEGSEWDPNSIMHYQFEKGLILKPEQYQEEPLIPDPGLSPSDIIQVRRMYPQLSSNVPELKPFQSKILRLKPGDQSDFLIKPKESRKYSIQTFGPSDTVMVLFEEINGINKFIGGDDDSGSDKNALLHQRLERDHTYVVRIRLYYAAKPSDLAVMIW